MNDIDEIVLTFFCVYIVLNILESKITCIYECHHATDMKKHQTSDHPNLISASTQAQG